MRLHDPWLLLLLGLLPLLWLRLRRPGSNAHVYFPTTYALRDLPTGTAQRWRWLIPALRCTALALLAVAMARPQLGRAESEYRGEGVDIMLSVDISGSMLAEDFTLASGERANRLDALKSVVRDFVAKRPNDRVGLVLFGARPYTQCPLTLDHGWLLQNLDRAHIGMIEDGTAIGSALATAGSRLEASSAKSKIIILLTDGQSNAGPVSPLTAAAALQTLGIKIYTIGAGTKGMAPFPAKDVFGNKVYRAVPVDIDEATLKEVAERTGGTYFRATDTDTLKQIYADIDRMERTDFSSPRYLDYDELYPWLVCAALALIATESFLSQTRLRTLP